MFIGSQLPNKQGKCAVIPLRNNALYNLSMAGILVQAKKYNKLGFMYQVAYIYGQSNNCVRAYGTSYILFITNLFRANAGV